MLRPIFVRFLTLEVEKIFPQTFRGPLLYVTIATVLNNLVNFIVQIAAARILGPQEFGVLSLAFSVALLTGAIGELGLNLTMIRLFNYHHDNLEKQRILLGSVFIFKVVVFVGLLLFSVPLGYLLAQSFGRIEYWLLFAVALATGGLLLFWTYQQALFQCYRQFTNLASYMFIYSGLRLIALVSIFALLGQSPLGWLLAIYTVPTMILFGVGLLPKIRQPFLAAVSAPKENFAILKATLAYSKWVALSGIVYIAMPYVARFILAFRGSMEEVGIFSAGMTFTAAFSTLNTALQAVLFPQVTTLKESKDIKVYLRKLRYIAPYYLGFATAGIVALSFLQWLVLGREYYTALPVFVATASAFAVSVLLYLETMLLHTLMRPDIDAVINLIGLLLFVVLVFFVSSNFGAIGVAVTYGCLIIIGGICKRVWLARMI